MLIRCSQLKLLMTSPRLKSEALSETAKTLIKDLVKESVFGVRKKITSKAIEKGIRCEDASIDLLNSVLFESYVKHVGRVFNDYITGECDILTDTSVRDIKTSWSIDTFPMFEDDMGNDYEWQMRGYMWLYNRDCAIVDYCLVDTPEDLIGYEQRELHIVSHINPIHRVRSIAYNRDAQKEQLIIDKVTAAREYYNELIKQLQAR